MAKPASSRAGRIVAQIESGSARIGIALVVIGSRANNSFDAIETIDLDRTRRVVSENHRATLLHLRGLLSQR